MYYLDKIYSSLFNKQIKECLIISDIKWFIYKTYEDNTWCGIYHNANCCDADVKSRIETSHMFDRSNSLVIRICLDLYDKYTTSLKIELSNEFLIEIDLRMDKVGIHKCNPFFVLSEDEVKELSLSESEHKNFLT